MTGNPGNRQGVAPEVAARIRLVILDVDGVLTDAGVYLGESEDGSPLEMKRFDIQDGLGIKFLKEAGIRVILVSGRISEATRLRARELGIEEYQDSRADKLPAVEKLLQDEGLTWEEVAVVGDDLPDLPLLRAVGLPVAVANAVPEVREVARWITQNRGGRGAVREFARGLLMVRGEWTELVEAYCAVRSGD